jgi:hypothetical protein
VGKMLVDRFAVLSELAGLGFPGVRLALLGNRESSEKKTEPGRCPAQPLLRNGTVRVICRRGGRHRRGLWVRKRFRGALSQRWPFE